jgi:hypothetical protein
MLSDHMSAGTFIITHSLFTFRDLDHECWKLLNEIRGKLSCQGVDGSTSAAIQTHRSSRAVVQSDSGLVASAALVEEVKSKSSSSKSKYRSISNDKMAIRLRRRRSKSRTRSIKSQ